MLLCILQLCIFWMAAAGSSKHLYAKISRDGFWKVGTSSSPASRRIGANERHPRTPPVPKGAQRLATVAIFYHCQDSEIPLLDRMTEKGFTVATKKEVRESYDQINRRPTGSEWLKPGTAFQDILTELAALAPAIDGARATRLAAAEHEHSAKKSTSLRYRAAEAEQALAVANSRLVALGGEPLPTKAVDSIHLTLSTQSLEHKHQRERGHDR